MTKTVEIICSFGSTLSMASALPHFIKILLSVSQTTNMCLKYNVCNIETVFVFGNRSKTDKNNKN